MLKYSSEDDNDTSQVNDKVESIAKNLSDFDDKALPHCNRERCNDELYPTESKEKLICEQFYAVINNYAKFMTTEIEKRVSNSVFKGTIHIADTPIDLEKHNSKVQADMNVDKIALLRIIKEARVQGIKTSADLPQTIKNASVQKIESGNVNKFYSNHSQKSSQNDETFREAMKKIKIHQKVNIERKKKLDEQKQKIEERMRQREAERKEEHEKMKQQEKDDRIERIAKMREDRKKQLETQTHHNDHKSKRMVSHYFFSNETA